MQQEGESLQELDELHQVHVCLDALYSGVEYIRDNMDFSDQAQTQLFTQQYASVLAYLPKAIGLLHDYQRHAHALYVRADQLLAALEAARKSPDALSSEEQRVLVRAASLQEITQHVIGALENLLSHVRATSQDVLAILAYQDDDFEEFSKTAYERINLSRVILLCYEQTIVIQQLMSDLEEFATLEVHVEQLDGA